MPTSAQCETCGRALDDSSGLCPNCLLRTAIDHGVAQALVPTLPKLHYFGDYELLEEIARGGMGVVYRARQISLDRIVAVKMMRPGLLATDAEIQRFHAEAKTAAGLQHPNIVAIHEVGEIDGLHYFSMDFVDGRSLAELVRKRALPPREASSHVKTLAETVQYAHDRGILHRDLKPSNILIDAAGRPRITDFGLARPFTGDPAVTAPGSVVGTPAYMPPEQAAGDQSRVGPASDIYSLGAVLYELLTGSPPFRGATQMDTMRMVIDDAPTAPRKLNGGVPRDLEAVCLRCLEKDPSRRYTSARDLAAALNRGRSIPRWTWVAVALAAMILALVFLSVRTEKPAAVPPPPIVALPVPATTVHSTPKKVAPPRPPVAIAASVSPNVGKGNEAVFTFRYLVPEGGPKIFSVQIDFHQQSADCNLFIEPESRRVQLQFDPARGPNLRVSGVIGTVATLENPVCRLNLTDLAVESHGNQLEVRLPVTFKPAFDGPIEIHSWPWDDQGHRGQSRIQSNWTVAQP